MRDVDVDADMFIWLGECQIGKNQITTFDGVVYDPRFVDECQYMVVAATGPDDKSVILLDRGSNAQNQVLAFHFYGFAKHYLYVVSVVSLCYASALCLPDCDAVFMHIPIINL